jgi:hypothetical protein
MNMTEENDNDEFDDGEEVEDTYDRTLFLS